MKFIIGDYVLVNRDFLSQELPNQDDPFEIVFSEERNGTVFYGLKGVIDLVPEDALTPFEKVNDPVNHPKHYTDGKIEVIDFIDDKKLGFCLGNAVKYISRAGKKDPAKRIEDLQKAVWYIEWQITKWAKENI